MNARFAFACSRAEDLPPASLTEIAVAGRSNCGKSSLINALTGHSKLARTSSTPGRTQQIIFFQLSLSKEPKRELYLVDLPGYGYARAARSLQGAWARLVNHYIDSRPTLGGLFLLNDIRRQPEEEENDLLKWTAQRGIEARVVLTKADKINKSQRFAATERAKSALGLQRRPLAFSVGDPRAIAALRRALAQLPLGADHP